MVVAEEEEARADESGGAEGEGALFELVEPVSSHAMGVGRSESRHGWCAFAIREPGGEGPCNRREG